MNDIAKPTGPLLPEPSGPFRSLQTAREAKNLASVTAASPPDEEQKALTRLDRLLNGGDPVRGDVPRGYYFNIRV
jgi:hypothetical protein